MALKNGMISDAKQNALSVAKMQEATGILVIYGLNMGWVWGEIG